MAAITTAEITSQVIGAERVSVLDPAGSGGAQYAVTLKISINSAGNATYVAGGLPLDLLFTTGNANDCFLDFAQPIVQRGMGVLWKGDIATDANVALQLGMFYRQKNTTAASGQKLVIAAVTANAGMAAFSEMSGDLSGATFFAATGVHVGYITLVGRIRPGVTPNFAL